MWSCWCLFFHSTVFWFIADEDDDSKSMYVYMQCIWVSVFTLTICTCIQIKLKNVQAYCMHVYCTLLGCTHLSLLQEWPYCDENDSKTAWLIYSSINCFVLRLVRIEVLYVHVHMYAHLQVHKQRNAIHNFILM